MWPAALSGFIHKFAERGRDKMVASHFLDNAYGSEGFARGYEEGDCVFEGCAGRFKAVYQLVVMSWAYAGDAGISE